MKMFLYLFEILIQIDDFLVIDTNQNLFLYDFQEFYLTILIYIDNHNVLLIIYHMNKY